MNSCAMYVKLPEAGWDKIVQQLDIKNIEFLRISALVTVEEGAGRDDRRWK